MIPRIGRSGLALVAALALAGCGSQEIYGQLKEDQANDMIAALRDAHIDAAKSADKDGQWAVAVSPDDFSKAIQLLRAKGLPREDFANLGSLFEKKGLVSGPAGGPSDRPPESEASARFREGTPPDATFEEVRFGFCGK